MKQSFIRTSTMVVLLAWAGAWSMIAVGADSPAPGEAALTAKGLTKLNGFYLLDYDVKLAANLAPLRQAKAKILDVEKQRASTVRQIRAAKADADAKYNKFLEFKGLIDKAKDPSNHNQWVKSYNDALDRTRAAVRVVDELQKKLATFPDYSQEYEDALSKASAGMEATVKQYDALSKDPQVTAALTALTKPGTAPKLGPSANFTQWLTGIRKDVATVKPDAIKFQAGVGAAIVPVVLNGRLTTPMVVDSGASFVSLSKEVADRLELKPDPNAKPIKLTIADGSQIESKIMILESVTLGHYTVKNIQCVIAGKGKGADCLLGATFLENFVYRMDFTAGLLHLQPLPDSAVVAAGATTATDAGPSAPSAPSAKTGVAGDAFRGRPTTVPWTQGGSPRVSLIDNKDGFAVLGSIGGKFDGYGEVVRVGTSDSGDWVVAGASKQDGVRADAIVIKRDGKTPFKADVSVFSWKNGQDRVRLISREEGFCYLAGISGHFEGDGEKVWVSADEDGFYYLNGKSGQKDLYAWAIAVKPENYAKLFTTEPVPVTWTEKGKPQQIMKLDEGFCYLTMLQGGFRGAGQELGLRISEDGYWILDGIPGKEFHGMSAKAMAVRYR